MFWWIALGIGGTLIGIGIGIVITAIFIGQQAADSWG